MRIDSNTTGFLFPGQGSQEVGMGEALARNYPEAREVFRMADDLIGYPLSRVAWYGPTQELDDTVNTQPALLVHSVAALVVFQNRYPDFQPKYVAGHSMGELSALVAAGALSFPDALFLVQRRGQYMKLAGEQTPGGMAAVLGLEIPILERICAAASTPAEIVQVANDNCPGQVVISGARPALERAIPLAQEAGARKVVPLAVSIAAHSPLMANAQDAFNQAVDAASLSNPRIPIIGNVSASPLNTIAEISSDLKAQLSSRVRWTETIHFMLSQGMTRFLEFGSGSVLCGLLRRIKREAECVALGEPVDFDKLVLEH